MRGESSRTALDVLPGQGVRTAAPVASPSPRHKAPSPVYMGAPADQPGPPLPLETHKRLRPSRSLPLSLKRAASTHFHGPEPQPF